MGIRETVSSELEVRTVGSRMVLCCGDMGAYSSGPYVEVWLDLDETEKLFEVIEACGNALTWRKEEEDGQRED